MIFFLNGGKGGEGGAPRGGTRVLLSRDGMSSVVMRNIKVLGDTFHLVCYPLLFWGLRHDRRVGVSLNSQALFFIALLFRYAAVLRETEEMLDSVKALSGLRDGHLSIDALVQIYKKKHSAYTFILRLVPLLASAASVLRISMSLLQHEPRDRLSWKVFLVPCVTAAALLHHHMNPPVTRQDPWAVLKTSSYLIEAIAIIPQLYLDHGLRLAGVGRRVGDGRGRGAGEEVEGYYASAELEAHFVTRGFFRGAYVFAWLSKIVQSGKGLQGSFGDNVQQLAGLLQMILYFEVFAAYVRRRSGVMLMVSCGLILLHVKADMELFLQIVIGIMAASCALSQLLGGFTMVQLTILYFIAQFYRAGVLIFKLPFSAGEYEL